MSVHGELLQLHPTLCDPMDFSPSGCSVFGDSPGKNTGVGCHALLQGIFPTQEFEPTSLMSPALAGGFFTTSTTWEAHLGENTSVIKIITLILLNNFYFP